MKETENKTSIIVTKVVRIEKTKKTLIEYLMKDVKGTNIKGSSIHQLWLEGTKYFDSFIEEKNMYIPLDAEFEYVICNNGQYRISLTQIYDTDCSCLLV